ncbi:MAG: HisA/HisF-related TIM barrel protein, partial [Planctomycetota bacterium]
MDYRRLIPCLDVKDGRLVKGVHFVKLKDVGDPAESAAVYSEAGADELVFLDITATIENRKTLLDAVKRTVERISVPLTVGGGIRDCQVIEELMDIG